MKNIFKVLGFTISGIVVLAYFAFLFILPNVIDLNKYKPVIQKLVEEQSGLSLDFENPKIITTPLLGAGIKAYDISVKMPDGSLLFSADSLKTRISLPSIFLLTVKVSCLEVGNPFVNLEIIDDDNFKISKHIENLLNAAKEQRRAAAKQTAEAESSGFVFNPAWIRIKVPNVKLYSYKVLVNDLKSGHTLTLKGDKLEAGYFNGKTAKLKTYAELFSDENKNITANININTFLPAPQPKLDEEDDPAERIDIPFVNPVTMYRNYDLKVDLDTKLLVRNHKGRTTSYGHLYTDNITLKVSQLKLPESYFRAETFGTNVTLDTNIYAAAKQNINLAGKFNYGSHPRMDMTLKTEKIQFNDLVVLTKAFMDSLHIKNELSSVKAQGHFQADCRIKTNFKKLRSSGSAVIKNGGVSVGKLGSVLSNANINILLDNNILQIKDSSLYAGKSAVSMDGKIDEKSIADLTVKTEKMSLPLLFNAFAPKSVRDSYNFKSGDISFDIALKGKLKEAVASLAFALNNFNLSDSKSSFAVENKTLSGEIFCDSKDLTGKINNNDFVIKIPKTGTKLSVPKVNIEIADKNIDIKENTVLLNNKSSVKYSGSVVDYTKLKELKFLAEGSVNTDDLIQLAGNEFKPFIHSKGSIPVKLSLDGDKRKQTLLAQALGDKENFITPVDFKALNGKNTSLQTVVDFKPNRIKIKKTGLFTRSISVDDEGNEVVSLDEVFGIDGTIEGNRINLVKITMPHELQGKIFVFPNSEFFIKGRAFIFGELSSPRIRGGYTLRNVSIPELLLALKEANLHFKGHSAVLNAKDLILNGSDIQSQINLSLLPAEIMNIKNVDISSKYLNVDKLMQVVECAMKYVPQSTASASASSGTADIPVSVKDGSINFSRIISGNIDIRNTTGKISLVRNVFLLSNLRTNIFNGSARGNISMNLISTLLDIHVQGHNIDVDKALVDAAGMKDTLSGTAEFKADISLKGATYEEQMQSLKGDVEFDVKDGQFGPFGKIENLIIAENIRESQFFQTALGGIISGLTTIDTTHFAELKGNISFKDGVCHIDPITSLGDILSLHIAGDFDILKNYADMKVRARMASLISNLLGPIGAINPANLINSAASLNIVTAKAFSIFCEMIPESELNSIPSFANSYVDNSATKFQLVVRGDAAKPLTLIKSFKWLASESEYNNAVDYVSSIPEPVEESQATTIEEVVQEVEAEKKTLKYKLVHFFKKDKTDKNIQNSENSGDTENKQIEDVTENTNNAENTGL